MECPKNMFQGIPAGDVTPAGGMLGSGPCSENGHPGASFYLTTGVPFHLSAPVRGDAPVIPQPGKSDMDFCNPKATLCPSWQQGFFNVSPDYEGCIPRH